ncbi:MAG: hypothetical protein K2M16_06720 [Muribaculaceae bacterium]|nr:hypothetical protein [Muribaculaceae bacterium]
MKKSLLFSVAIAAACSASAAVPGIEKVDASAFSAALKLPAMDAKTQSMTRSGETFDFTYAGLPSSGYSLQNTTGGKTRVYIGFEMKPEDIRLFAGSKLTGFSIYTPFGDNMSDNTITDARFFYSYDLTNEDYKQDFKMTASPATENRIMIDEPYTITGEEESLCFGYSFVVPEKDNMAYLITDGIPASDNTGFYSASNTDNFPSEFYSFAGEIGALCMSLIMEVEDFPQFVAFTSMPSTLCLPLGQKSSLPITVAATSADPIESLSIEYALGGETYSDTFASSSPLPAGVGRLIELNLEIPAQKEKLNELVQFKLTKINGKENVCDGSVAEVSVVVVDEVPVHRTLYEEYTSTTCGYCTRGYAAIEYMKKNHPDFVTVSFHSRFQSADPMQVTTSFPNTPSGFPSAFLNRSISVDPYYGTQSYMNMELPVVGDILALNAVPTAWKIDVTHEWASENELVAKAMVSNMAGFKNGNHKIAYILVADGLSGATVSWSQTNYYNTESPAFIPELNDFCRGGKYGKSRVVGLVFNDVVVSGNGIHGVEGSVPDSLEPEEIATHSMTFDLSEISSTLIPDKSQLRIVAAILDAKGEVLNCAKDEVNDTSTAVAGLESEDAPVEYFNLNGMKVAQPTEGIFIRRQGSKTEKVVIR